MVAQRKAPKTDIAALAWAKARHYPQVVPGQGLVIRAGELAWRSFYSSATPEEKRLATARMKQWTALEHS